VSSSLSNLNKLLDLNPNRKKNRTRTTISISYKNYLILKKLGTIGDSFDKVISELLKDRKEGKTTKNGDEITNP
jgi:hypothetical protein